MVEAEIVTPQMIAQFVDPEDPIMYSNKITKLSRYNFKQSRVFIITADYIYIFSGKKLNRRHKIGNLVAIIMSEGNAEFVLHFPAAKDLRITGLEVSDREEIIAMIKLRYMIKQPKTTLMIFCVPGESLKMFS